MSLLPEQVAADAVPAEAVYSVGQAFALDSFVSEEYQDLFYHIRDFLFRGECDGKFSATLNLMAGLAADADAVAIPEPVQYAKSTFVFASAAADAGFFIDIEFSFFDTGLAMSILLTVCRLIFCCSSSFQKFTDGFARQFCCRVGLPAGFFYLADGAGLAFVVIRQGCTDADDAHVVEVGLGAIIRTAADSDFEFLGKFYSGPAGEKMVELLLRKGIRVDEPVFAGSSHAGRYGTDQHVRAVSHEAVTLQKFQYPVKLILRNAFYGYDLPGRYLNLASAIFFRRLRQGGKLAGGKLSISGDQPDIINMFKAVVLHAAALLPFGTFTVQFLFHIKYYLNLHSAFGR